MALSTITLNQTLNWAMTLNYFLPGNIGPNNEPAITAANTIIQTMLAPPFTWRWNRNNASIASTTVGVTDYVVSIPDFGFLESVTVEDASGNYHEVEIRDILSENSSQERPQFVSVQSEDSAGNITFRFMPAPDQVYSVSIVYQKAAPLFSSLSTTWTPIPDFLSFVYNWGLLSILMEYADRTLALNMRQLFVGSLLSVSEGLTESEKNQFMSVWLGNVRDQLTTQANVNLGTRGRAF